MGKHRALLVAGDEDSRRWVHVKDLVLDWAGFVAVVGGYYLLCLYVNDWDWLYAAFAWVAGVAIIGVVVAIGVGIDQVMGSVADLDGDSWWHGIAEWGSDRWDSRGDGDDGGDGGDGD